MSESKTYVFGQDGNSNLSSIIAPLLSQRGIDPSILYALNNNGGFGGNGSWFIWVLFLLVLSGRFGAGLDSNRNATEYLGNMLNNDTGRELLSQLIQGNTSKLGELSNTLNCDVNSIKTSINAVMSAIQQVGNQVGMNGLQTINAIQSGNASIASQLAKCCCDNQLAICQQTNTLQQAINGVNIGQERGFSQIGFETQKQTCEVRDAIRENTAQVLAGQRAAEMRELQREISERDRKIAEQAVVINNGQQTAMFGQMISQATAPIAAAVSGIKADVDGIKCKLPETTTIPYSPVVGIPSCVAAQYGLGFGFNQFGIWG